MPERQPAEPADRAAVLVADAIAAAEFRSSLRRFLRQSERAAHRAGLTPQRYLLLLMIAGARDRSGTGTVTDLARRLQLAQSTVTELVQRAVQCELIAREPSRKDARTIKLRLTPEGQRRLQLSFTQLTPERLRLLAEIHTPPESAD